VIKQRGVLLGTNDKTKYKIDLELQQGRTATFIYSDRQMAKEHYAQLTAQGVVGGVAIRNHTFGEFDEKRKNG